MQLLRVRLGHFWDERALNLEFAESRDHGTSMSFLIGPNGAGKSRVLETLGRIFSHLASGLSPGVDFDIEYELGGRRVLITTRPPEVEPRAEILQRRLDQLNAWLLTADEPGPWLAAHARDRWPSDLDTVLPSRVVGVSTGPTSRLGWALNQALEDTLAKRLGSLAADSPPVGIPLSEWEAYRRSERQLIENELRAALDQPRCVALTGPELGLAILALLGHRGGSPDLAQRRHDLFGRVRIDPRNGLVGFTIDVASAWRERVTPGEQTPVELLLDRASRRLMLPPAASPHEGQPADADERAIFEADDALHEWIGQSADTPLIWFDRMLSWLRRGVIRNVRLVVNQSDRPGLLLDGDLSDGEFLLLGRYGLLLLLRDVGDALVLLDEPETHFNDRWKVELVNDLGQLLDAEDLPKAHVLIATHSDLTLSDADRTEVRVLEPLLTDDASSVRLPPVSPFAADRQEITTHVFGAAVGTGRRAVRTVDAALESGERSTLREAIARVGPGFHRFRLEYLLRKGDDDAS